MDPRIFNPESENRCFLSSRKVILFTSLGHHFPLALNIITTPTTNQYAL